MTRLPEPTDIPNYPICPQCGSRFAADGHRDCPQCRDTPPMYGERLATGFAMLNDEDE